MIAQTKRSPVSKECNESSYAFMKGIFINEKIFYYTDGTPDDCSLARYGRL